MLLIDFKILGVEIKMPSQGKSANQFQNYHWLSGLATSVEQPQPLVFFYNIPQPNCSILHHLFLRFGYRNRIFLRFSLHYCYVTIFHPVVSKIKLRFYLKPVNREYPYLSVGMRAAAIIAMCRTLCSYSPAHKILGNQTTYFSTTHACFQISRKLARCETNLRGKCA